MSPLDHEPIDLRLRNGIASTFLADVEQFYLRPRVDEEALIDETRYLISFLPQNNVDPPPYAEPSPSR